MPFHQTAISAASQTSDGGYYGIKTENDPESESVCHRCRNTDLGLLPLDRHRASGHGNRRHGDCGHCGSAAADLCFGETEPLSGMRLDSAGQRTHTEEKQMETDSAEQLKEAKRQIDSIRHKLQATVAALRAKENSSRYQSQITLAERRIQAFDIAEALMEEKLRQMQ